MPIFVVGAVVLGLATATESAGLGVLCTFIIGLVIIRELRLKAIPKLLRDSIQTSATVMIIIALSKLYVWILALERIPQTMTMFVTGLELPVFVILFVVLIIILIVGTFVDVSPAILLFTPVFLPAMKMLGINGIQFGVILISDLAMGLVHAAGGHVPQCVLGHLQTPDRNNLQSSSSLSAGQFDYPDPDYLFSNPEPLVAVTADGLK